MMVQWKSQKRHLWVNVISTNIYDNASTSRTEVTAKVTPKSLKRKREEEIQAEEIVGKTENVKKIKTTENVRPLKRENNKLNSRMTFLSLQIKNWQKR